jgi:chaperonin GroES
LDKALHRSNRSTKHDHAVIKILRGCSMPVRLTVPVGLPKCAAVGTHRHRVPMLFNLEPKGVNQMAFKPLHDRVLVRRIQGEDKTKGGLIIPDTAKEKPAEGEIVSVGEGARKDSGELIAPSVKAGDRILFGKWSGTEVTLNGEELLIMKESDILGIIS